MPAKNITGVNHAVGLPAIDNQDIQYLLNNRISSYIISSYRQSLPINLFLTVDMDVELCDSTTYLCEDTRDLPQMSDSALNAKLPRHVINPPRTVTFSGFCKGGFETKLAKEQAQCINRSEVLRNWYQFSMARAIEDGKEALMARFYRHLVTNGVHPLNTGHAAGQEGDPQDIGTPSEPVLVTPDNIHIWDNAILEVIKQMPRATPAENRFGLSVEDGFMFTAAQLENTYRNSPFYNDYDRVGDCAGCHAVRQTFDRMPRGLLPITSYCIEKRVITSGGKDCVVYPVLFGRRYMGTKAALRVDTSSYECNDDDSIIFKSTFYWHVHTYDNRYLGLSWITIVNPQPETISCG